MAISVGALKVDMAADPSQMIRGLEQGSRAMDDAGEHGSLLSSALSSIGAVASGVATVGIAAFGAALAGAAAVGGAALASWNELDAAADSLTLKTGATGDALNAMTESVKAIYNSSAGLNQSMEDIAGVMASVEKITGATGPVLEGITAQFGYLTQAEGESAGSAEQFARAMQGWGVPAEEMAAELDKQYAAFQKTGIGANELNTVLVQFGGQLRSMGLSLGEAEGLLSGMYGAGINAEKAMAGLSTAAGKFAKDGVDMETGLRSAISAMQNAGSASEAASIGVATFGARAGVAIAEGVRAGKISLDDLSATLGDTTGALQNAVNATMDFPEQWQLLSREVMTALEPLGTAIASLAGTTIPMLKPAADAVAGALVSVGEAAQTVVTALQAGESPFRALAAGAAKLGLDIGGLEPIFKAVQNAASTVFAALPNLATQAQTAISGVTSAGSALGSAIAFLGPLAQSIFSGIITVVQSALPGAQAYASAIGQVLVAAFQAFQQVATAVFTALQPYLPALQAAIAQAAQVLGSTLNVALTALASFLTGTVVPAISTLANWLAANLPGAIAATAGFIQNNLVPALQFVGGLIQQYVIPALNGLMSVLQGPVATAVKDVAGFVANVLVAAWQGLVNFIQGAMPTMSGAVTGAFEIIGGAIQTVTGILQTVAAVVHGIITGDWEGAWRDAQAGVQTAIDGIKQILSGAIDEVVSIVTSIMNGIASAIAGKKTDIVGEMAATATAAWDAFTSINWGKLGGDIVAGIARGIENGASAIKDAALNAARAALEAAKNFLGISSPSKAAAEEIGQPLAAGIAVGIMGGADLVAQGLRQLLAGGLAAGVDAMHQLASAFRAVFNAFSGSADGIGGNAVNHVRRLINAISEITGSVQDFLKMLGDLEAFAGSSAAGLALSSGGQDFLSSLFAGIAHLAQRMALSARQAAEGFINSEVGAALKGLAEGLAGARAVVEQVVGSVTALLTEVGGTAIETALNNMAEQNWLVNLMGAIAGLAVRLNTAAQAAAGNVPAASASLKNLAEALQPFTGVITSTVSIITALLTQVGGTVVETVLNDLAAQDWLDNLMGAIVIMARKLNTAAQAAAGDVPAASASLTNLNNALQPLTGVITSTVGVLKALNDAIQSSVVTGAISGPMSEFWQALYELISVKLVELAVKLAAAATVAAGEVPAATASLTNLSNALQPFSGVVTSTIGIIKALGEIVTNDDILALLGGQGASLAQAVYELIAGKLVEFAVALAKAAEAAVGTVPAVSASLTNLASALQPMTSVITSSLRMVNDLFGAGAIVIPDDAAVTAKVTAIVNTVKAIGAVLNTGLSGELVNADVASSVEALRNLLLTLQQLIEQMMQITSADGALHIGITWDIPSLMEAIAAIPVPTIVIPVKLDMPTLPKTAGGYAGSGYGAATTNYNTVNNVSNTVINQQVTGGVAAATAQTAITMSALFGASPV